jgi:hypothetical protein
MLGGCRPCEICHRLIDEALIQVASILGTRRRSASLGDMYNAPTDASCAVQIYFGRRGGG